MTRLRALWLTAAAASSLAAGCVLGPLSLEDRHCPCAAGWRCDTARDVCVLDAARPCATRADCPSGQSCIDGRCVGPDAGPPCVPVSETCDGDDQDCDGVIDDGESLCSLQHATARCARGACVIERCRAGFADCDGRAETGCETALGTTTDCGACDDVCRAPTPFCAPGSGETRACAASCPADLSECGGACVDTDVDLHHCGACDAECAPVHGVGRCAAGACSIAGCEPSWADCDDDTDTGCEASLESDRTCGTCSLDCTAATSGTCTIGRCDAGACVTVPGGPGVTCRPAASVCDVAETCSADGTCPPDRFAVAGIACRDSACGGLDPRELCTGTSGTCPPPCGCEREPCCPGVNACSAGLECRSGRCEACTPVMGMLAGAFPMPDSMTVLRTVRASGSTLSLTDGLTPPTAIGSITLPTGVTASGSFTPPCGMFCDWLSSVSASGTMLTLTSGGLTGGTPVSATITLSGATGMGSVTATPLSPTIAGYFVRVSVSGDTLTFVDSMGATGTLRILPTALPCAP